MADVTPFASSTGMGTDFDVDAEERLVIVSERHVAARMAEAPAVVDDELALTYRELQERANCLAHHLGAMGVVPDDREALSVEHSPESVVPLDPDDSAQRVATAIEGAKPVLECSFRAFGPKVELVNTRVLGLAGALNSPGLSRAPNRKIDREKLALLAPASFAGDGFVTPRTPAEGSENA